MPHLDLNAIGKPHGVKPVEVGDVQVMHLAKAEWCDALKLLGYKDDFVADFTEAKLRTASIGKLILEAPNNLDNRHFGLGDATAYAFDVLGHQEGDKIVSDWHDNYESCTYDRRGAIVSIQHRLAALLIAEKMRQVDLHRLANGQERKYHFPLNMRSSARMPLFIVYGVAATESLRESVDKGRPRKGHDALFIKMRKDGSNRSASERKGLATAIATAAKVVWTRFGGKVVADRTKFPTPELMQFLRNHPKFSEIVETVVNFNVEHDRSIGNFIAVPQWAGLVYMFATSGTDPLSGKLDLSRLDLADKFTEEFATGADLPAGHPALVLRDAYLADKSGGTRDRDLILNRAVMAWKHRVDGVTAGLKKADITPKRKDTPRCGGLDVDPAELERLLSGGETDTEQAAEAADHAEGNGEAPAKPAKARKRKAATAKVDAVATV